MSVGDFSTDDRQGPPAPDARPQTLLMGLASGGLIGMLTALDTSEDETGDGGVEDPEALRRAEEAVRHDPVERPRGPHIDEAWAKVARQYLSDDYVGLMDVAAVLESEGIDFGWDPYDPRQNSGLALPDFGDAVRREYSIGVPESQFARAREALYGVPPHGVIYAWSEGAVPSPVPEAALGEGAGSEFASSAPSRPVTAYGPMVSDNERLERLAGGGLPSGTIALAVIAALLGIGAAAFFLTR